MSEIAYVFLGGGFLMGVPARDLTAQDVEVWELDEEMLVQSGLYRKVASEEKSQVKKSRKVTVGGE